MNSPVLDRVIQVIIKAARLDPKSAPGADTGLLGSGISLDSVGLLEVLLALETEFGIELDAEELLRANAVQTLGALAAFIERKTAPGT